MMEERVFLNGRFVSRQAASLPVIEPGFLQGWGVFETMRSYQGNIVLLHEHIRRLQQACERIDIPLTYSSARLKKAIQSTVSRNYLEDAYVRLTVWKKNAGVNTLIFVRKYTPYSRRMYSLGLNVCVSKIKVNEDHFLAGIKTTSRIPYEAAYREAEIKNCQEAIMVTTRGHLSEGSRSNVFFVNAGKIFTPSLQCGCLSGVTRQAVFALAQKRKIGVREGRFALKDIVHAEEAFLTNSLFGVMPIKVVDGERIGKGAEYFTLTKLIMKDYGLLLKNA